MGVVRVSGGGQGNTGAGAHACLQLVAEEVRVLKDGAAGGDQAVRGHSHVPTQVHALNLANLTERRRWHALEGGVRGEVPRRLPGHLHARDLRLKHRQPKRSVRFDGSHALCGCGTVREAQVWDCSHALCGTADVRLAAAPLPPRVAQCLQRDRIVLPIQPHVTCRSGRMSHAAAAAAAAGAPHRDVVPAVTNPSASMPTDFR